jgi:hypothetical protein
VRPWDAKKSIYDGLRALPRRRYLCAMWILGGEVRSLYEDRLTAEERSLMTSTLEVVREVSSTGEATTGAAGRAAELADTWMELIIRREDEAQVLPGHWNAWAVFASLAEEIAGKAPPGEGTERLANAATERWREPYPGRARRLDPGEEVDDSSPMARTLAAFQRVVTAISDMPESELDPAAARARILG